VAKRIEQMKMTAMRGTTKKGEEMLCTVGTPYSKGSRGTGDGGMGIGYMENDPVPPIPR
jgi:hypothetical protein